MVTKFQYSSDIDGKIKCKDARYFFGVFSRGRMHSCSKLSGKSSNIFFLLHSEKVRELVFQSSDRVKEKEKDSICHCIVSFPRAEKKFCKKTAYRSRQFPHTFMTFVWILNIYHGKVFGVE